MGLHAQIHQRKREVLIALNGEVRIPELDQLREILAHFQRRGCSKFVLDFSSNPPLSEAARASLDLMTAQSGFSTLQICAIRPQADSPAVRPQTGCGDLSFAAA